MSETKSTDIKRAGGIARFMLDAACSAGFVAYAASLVAVPICLLNMAEEMDFHLTGGGSLELIRCILLLFVLLIIGHITAFLGKQKLLFLGTLITAIGLYIMSYCSNYWGIFSCIMLIGFGSGILEALVNPVIQDLHEENSGKALNIINAFFPMGVLLSSLFIGIAMNYGMSWRDVFRIIAAFTVLVAYSFYLLRKVPLKSSTANTASISGIVTHPKFWLYSIAITCGGAIEASFTFWVASLVRLRFENLPSAGATGTAIFAISMFVGRLITGYLAAYATLRKLIVWSCLFGIVASLFIPLVNSMLAFQILVFCCGLATACLWPTILGLAAKEMPAADSTLLMIYLACFGVPGFGVAGWLIGWIGDNAGLSAGFFLVPLLFIILIVTIFVEKKYSRGIRRFLLIKTRK